MSKPQQTFLMTTSWDDGHPLDWRVAELLARYGLRGTFYVPRSGQRKVMNASEIRELSKSFEIGGHTLEHVLIDRLSDSEAETQLAGSRDWIEQLTGKSCLVFCFPGGRFRKRQLHLVRQAGYQAARTVELLSTALPRCIDGLCLIPTTVQVFPHSPFAYARNAVKRFSVSAVHWPSRSIFTRDWAALAKESFLQARERGGVFHLWGHSWEIDEQGQWERLEAILETFSSCREQWTAATNGELCEYPLRTVPIGQAPARTALAERVK